jgi:hypothetical protein
VANPARSNFFSICVSLSRSIQAGETMVLDKSFRRLPLRDLITDAEKRTRDLIQHFHTTWIPQLGELNAMCVPHRKKKHVPTLQALKNALDRMVEVDQNTAVMIDHLLMELEEIYEHALRECSGRP